MSDRERLRKAMGEAASLPPEDPLRQEIEQVISQEGEWAEKEWLEVLKQDEHFRIALKRVDVPANLETLLLEIPKVEGSRKTSSTILLVSTVAVVVLFIAALALFFSPKNGTSQVLQMLATLAINDHINNRHLKVETSNPVEFKEKLNGKVPFDVLVPQIGSDFKLAGGRPCKLGQHPIVYSLWKTSRGEYSLFQLKLSDLGLSSLQGTHLVKPKDPVMSHSPCEVLFWSKGEFGFILVADHGHLLNGISPR